MGGPEALGGFGKGVLPFAEGREGAVAVVPGRSVSLLLIVEDRGGPFEENFGVARSWANRCRFSRSRMRCSRVEPT